MRLGSLCTGIGGLDMAVEAVTGAELAWCAEIDSSPSAVLAERFDVPNLGDFRIVDLEPVDVLTAGFPCQPVSTAGRRAGTSDDRWLFDDICSAVGRMDPRPGLLVFENVLGLLSANDGHAMARVVHGLAALGYLGTYGVLGSRDVGACHRRERVWIVAGNTDRLAGTAPFAGRGRPGALGKPGPIERAERPDRVALLPTPTALDWKDTGDLTNVPTNALLGRHVVKEAHRWGHYRSAVERWAQLIGRPAPEPTEDGRLSPDFVEWMMGYPPGWTDVGLSRSARLRCLGNAVQPQTATAAIPPLLERLP